MSSMKREDAVPGGLVGQGTLMVRLKAGAGGKGQALRLRLQTTS